MVYLLRAFGHQTEIARNGAEAIEQARLERPDLILMDIHMPGMDGYEAGRKLKSDPKYRQIPIVAVTALAMVGDREKVMMSGFDGYISKPLEPESFLQQLKPFLETTVLRDPAPAAPEPTAALSRPDFHATILAVDNSPVNLHLLHSILDPAGYQLITVTSAAEALAAARKQRPDLILSDVHMPKASGYDLIKAVKADPDLRSIPFVFLSSTLLARNDGGTGIALGAAKFISRPIDPQALLEEIKHCLSDRK